MKKPLLVMALLGSVAYGGYRMLGDESTAHTDKSLVLDRVWIDHLPKSERDTVQVFIALGEEPFGLFQAASAWKGGYELFRHELHGNELRAVFPQNGDRETVKVNARACDEHDMDYCIELSGSARGVKRYYSRKGWEIENVKTPAALAERTEAILKRL